MNTVLSAQHVNKYFYDPEKFQVLKEVTFTVQQGEFLSIVGKSGCGKSTLLYLLSTMDTDYEGEIEMAGTKLKGRSQDFLSHFRNEHLGFVFQFHFLLPEFSALQNVMLPGLKLGKYPEKEVEERAMEKLRLIGMADYARKPASKLSGGQQQRVAIARALINDPTIVMGDEPTGNLDRANTENVFEIFRGLAQKGQTIIAVTHDPDFAARTDRVIEMSDGMIIASHENKVQ
ncbi:MULTISPECIES: ABC transporter ATP-binding protein [Spirosoma]|uniref:ABC transporter ATP-binding protein n=1 Tax=Spirosoma TaxID=107 RepID=UPI00096063D6|nr:MULTISPECIES: ABC transporter ATP-binding protein [Spirosoma]MBN8826141.1 ABC transporter ATP-binding protein [Spirosoma sp.]OJW74623.1 MAG: ATP-binding protein [Spirosoma sp. 48-14]